MLVWGKGDIMSMKTYQFASPTQIIEAAKTIKKDIKVIERNCKNLIRTWSHYFVYSFITIARIGPN